LEEIVAISPTLVNPVAGTKDFGQDLNLFMEQPISSRDWPEYRMVNVDPGMKRQRL
jgi:hypothetical protein